MNTALQHGKITLRPLEPEDIDLLYQWENAIEIWQVSNTKTPYSKHILAQYLAESAKDIYSTKQLRLIIENQEKVAVGAVDIFDFEPYHLRAGVGILIHKASERRKGYAIDALAALAEYSLEILGLKQLYANIGANNEVSIRLFEKSGYQLVGTKKYWLKNRDGWSDELLYQKILC